MSVAPPTRETEAGKREKKAIFFLREKSAPTAFPSILVRQSHGRRGLGRALGRGRGAAV